MNNVQLIGNLARAVEPFGFRARVIPNVLDILAYPYRYRTQLAPRLIWMVPTLARGSSTPLATAVPPTEMPRATSATAAGQRCERERAIRGNAPGNP